MTTLAMVAPRDTTAALRSTLADRRSDATEVAGSGPRTRVHRWWWRGQTVVAARGARTTQ